MFPSGDFNVYNGIYFSVNVGIYRKLREVVDPLWERCFHRATLAYIIAYTSIVNASIYMNFREAVDALCASLSHEDVAKALGVSLQTVRQARLREDSDAFRAPPKNWKAAIIRLAEGRATYYRRLVEKMKHSD